MPRMPDDILYSRDKPWRDDEPNPFVTLPRPTTEYIDLYIKLVGFDGTYRIVSVPSTFTFANLHVLLQFLFGWENSHLHRFEVVDHVKMDKRHKGEIRSFGRWTDLWRKFTPVEAQQYQEGKGHYPLMHVSVRPRVTFPDWFEGVDDDGVLDKLVHDPELTMERIWNLDEEHNACELVGCDCGNEEIAIKYVYDFGDNNEVHISLNGEQPYRTVREPSNEPIIKKAQGSAMREHAVPLGDGYEDEPDPAKKAIDDLFFEPGAFARYCASQLHTVAQKDKLEVYTEETRQEQIRERERREEERKRRREEQGLSPEPEDIRLVLMREAMEGKPIRTSNRIR
ncbi:unnamed protein product [Peniophora sp. CBMAI 1063]|nr:unnamed protein product [Peniophora sp. CBMAI 1063]